MITRISIIAAFAFAPTLTAFGQQPQEQPAPGWKAGVASTRITPQRRLYMAGYAARTEPAEGTEQDLFAKALAVEDDHGNRVVLITLDLIGVLDDLRRAVAAGVEEKHKIPPQALLINASHTHCGPAYGREDAQDYMESLKAALVELVGQALEQMQPATLAYSTARCSVAMNRRTPSDRGFLNHPNPEGPVDHAVPVLSVRRGDGELKAVVFGYACHNTTMGFQKWLGDYAGYAQQYFEEDHPGVTALFMMGCGGDQNPYPRRELKYAQMHGRSLATAVEAALEVTQTTLRHQQPLRGPLRYALETVDLEFAAADRPDFAYPVQVIRFGDGIMLVALGSEVTVDYSLRLKSELAELEAAAVWVAGYSNVYDGYIPSARVLLEGGYEARSRPWKPSLEQRIVGKVHELAQRTKLNVTAESTSTKSPIAEPAPWRHYHPTPTPEARCSKFSQRSDFSSALRRRPNLIGARRQLAVGAPRQIGDDFLGRTVFRIGENQPIVTMGIDRPISAAWLQLSLDETLLAWGHPNGRLQLAELPVIQQELAKYRLGW